MNFIIEYCEFEQHGQPFYIQTEHSFLYDPWLQCDFSLMIGPAYISVDVCLYSNKIMHISGLSPIDTWEKRNIQAPPSQIGILKMNSDKNYTSGTGITYAENWITTFDKDSGWICIGNELVSNQCEYVTFAKDTIAAIHQGKIATIWVKPIFK